MINAVSFNYKIWGYFIGGKLLYKNNRTKLYSPFKLPYCYLKIKMR